MRERILARATSSLCLCVSVVNNLRLLISMVSVVLRICDCFAWLLRWLGVDYAQFRSILETKLTLDNRKAVTPLSKATGKEPTNVLRATLITNFIFGLFLATTMLRLDSTLLSLMLIHAFI